MISALEQLHATLAGLFSGEHIRDDHRAALANGIPADVVVSDLPPAPHRHARW